MSLWKRLGLLLMGIVLVVGLLLWLPLTEETPGPVALESPSDSRRQAPVLEGVRVPAQAEPADAVRRPLDPAVTAGSRLIIRCLDEGGKAVAGAEVRVSSSSSRSIEAAEQGEDGVSEEDGSAMFVRPRSGRLTVGVTHRDYVPSRMSDLLPLAEITVVLLRATTIALRVVDEENRPLPTFETRLAGLEGGKVRFVSNEIGRDGYTTIRVPLASDQAITELVLEARARDHRSSVWRWFRPSPYPPEIALVLVSRMVPLLVVDAASDIGVVDAVVTGPFEGLRRTDERGRAAVQCERWSSNGWNLLVRHPDFLARQYHIAQAAVDIGDPLRVELDQGVPVTFFVCEEEGLHGGGLVDATVMIGCMEDGIARQVGRTDSRGLVTLRGKPGCTYRGIARRSDAGMLAFCFEVPSEPDGSGLDHRIVLRRYRSLAVRVSSERRSATGWLALVDSNVVSTSIDASACERRFRNEADWLEGGGSQIGVLDTDARTVFAQVADGPVVVRVLDALGALVYGPRIIDISGSAVGEELLLTVDH